MSISETNELLPTSPQIAFKKARIMALKNNYEAQLSEAKKKEETTRLAKQQEFDEMQKRKDEYMQYQIQNKLEKKTLQSSLASHYEQMANYQKALREREKQEEAMRAAKLIEENRLALEAEKQRKFAKIEAYKQQQYEFLKQKEELKQKNPEVEQFKRSLSTIAFKNKLNNQQEEIDNFQRKPIYFEEKQDESMKKMEQMARYKSILEAQIQEKLNDRQKKKDIFSSQAELNLKKMEEFKEFQRQEALRKREEQMKYRDFLNIQTSEKNDTQMNEINKSNFNSTNHSLVQLTPNLKQNNEKISFQNNNFNPDLHNPLLNPMPFNVQNPYLFKEYKKGLIPSNSKQNAYFANIANAELLGKNY